VSAGQERGKTERNQKYVKQKVQVLPNLEWNCHIFSSNSDLNGQILLLSELLFIKIQEKTFMLLLCTLFLVVQLLCETLLLRYYTIFLKQFLNGL
jgi:phosphoglycerol transferase MdoB-like AlkP superfamily enzyme